MTTLDEMPKTRYPDGSDGRSRLDRIGRFARLARALEAAGLYNGSKALRAGADRELTMVAAAGAQLGNEQLLAELQDLGREVAAAGYPTWFVRQLAGAADAVRAHTNIPFQDAPEVWSCRVCGELATEGPPAICPTCEAPAVVFRVHPAVWYLEPDQPASTLDLLARGADEIEAALKGKTSGQLERPPKPGEWSARETLEHITSAEELLSVRVRRMLDEDDPELIAWQPGEQAVPSDEATHHRPDADSTQLFNHYRHLRHATLAVLRDIDPESWKRRGRHPEWGPVTVLSQASYFARHQAAHQAQLAAALEGRVPGEPRRREPRPGRAASRSARRSARRTAT